MRIDSHQHFWQIARHGHEWPTPDLAPIYRDFGVDDWVQESSASMITGTVAVQSQPCDADTEWLLQLASQHVVIKGVVGWTDLAATHAASHLATLARHPEFKGVRPMLQSLPDDHWILRDSVQPALTALVELGLCFDALIYTRHLPAIMQLAKRHPALSIVIDHAAKPPIAQRNAVATRQWRDDIARVAEAPNVHCKLSGLFTEMSTDQSRDEAIPYAEHVLNVFGVERVMWGSDWPVLKLRDGYAQWHAWVMDRIAHLGVSQQAMIMGGNAQRFYKL